MREADYPRAQNRTRIDELFNGFPPYTPAEVEENNIVVNVNFLESTRLAHDARAQFNNAFMKPGNFFTLRTDMGPVHKRKQYGVKVTKAINRIMKRSLPYFETFRSKFALSVLHGIGPATFPDQDAPMPDAVSIADVLLPSGTYLTMKNLPMFVLPRSFTAPELMKLTNNEKTRDPGWQMENVEACIKWIDKESQALLGSNWPEIWAPEKMEERVKGDGGYYYGDKCPTIDVFDFYFYEDDGKDPGWRRRMVLDAWSTPEGGTHPTKKAGAVYESPTLLYTSGNQKYADKREHIVSFQFADLSAVAPFYYHSVRSLGFLLYAVCHLQNRLRCKFNESVFEALMMLFRVKNLDDAQKALKLDLINRGFVEEGIQPLTAAERYQVNTALVEMGIQENTGIINTNSSSYTPNTNLSQQGVEKTKFQVMAETNSMTSMISAGLTQAYMYQNFEYMESVRRFMKDNNQNVDVKAFRAEMKREGVPDKLLVAEYWDCEPERVMGAGNKTLEMTIANQLMEWRDKFDPEPQRDILRDAVLAITDDPARAEELVPEDPVKVTDSVHDAQIVAGTLMQGLPVGVKTGMNHLEYVQTLLVSLATVIQKCRQNGNMATADQIMGMNNLAGHIAEHIKIIAQDETAKAVVKQFSDQLGKLMNEVKGFAQRLQQMQQKQAEAQQQGNGQMDPKDQAKIQATMATAQAKIRNTRESHAQRTVQRDIQFQQQMKQDQQRAALEIAKEKAQVASELQAKTITTAVEVAHMKARNKAKPKPGSNE